VVRRKGYWYWNGAGKEGNKGGEAPGGEISCSGFSRRLRDDERRRDHGSRWRAVRSISSSRYTETTCFCNDKL
jgi:hypothetical protein